MAVGPWPDAFLSQHQTWCWPLPACARAAASSGFNRSLSETSRGRHEFLPDVLGVEGWCNPFPYELPMGIGLGRKDGRLAFSMQQLHSRQLTGKGLW